MNTAIRLGVAALVAADLPSGVVSAQVKANEPTRTVQISGHIVNPIGVPVSDYTVEVGIPNTSQATTAKINRDGRFTVPANSRMEQLLYLSELPNVAITIATVEDVDLGNIVVDAASHEATLDVLGPVQITHRRSEPDSGPPQNFANRFIAASFVASNGIVRVVHGDGKEVRVSKEKEQVGIQSLSISDDNEAVGWLLLFENCCTSYPIPQRLVVYRPGRPLRRFGGGMGMWDWSFVEHGKQVAFYTDTVHGNLAPHFELRDVRTEQMLSRWDGRLNKRSPAWTRLLKFD